MSALRAHLPESLSAVEADLAAALQREQELIGSARLIIRAADRMARGVQHYVDVGLLNARSEPADALLDYQDLDDHRADFGLPPFAPPGEVA